MNASSSIPTPAADEQAALWAVRLEGAPLAPVDHAALQKWLAEDSTHAERLADYRQLSFDLDQQLPALVKAGGLALPPAPAPAFARIFRNWIWVTGIAGLGAAAAVAVVTWMGRAGNAPQSVATPVGIRRSFTMADGTEVELNAATRIMIPTSTTERLVRMDDGEAFFHVAKDRAHPFIVETPAGSVEVTGTIFDVRSESPGQLEVTVVEGSVKVSPVGQGVSELLAGDHLEATGQGVARARLSDQQVSDKLAWREGRAVFVGTSVRDALAAYARYYPHPLTATEAAAAVKVGGSFHLDNLDEFLAGFSPTMHLQVNRSTDGSVRVSLQSEADRL